MTKPGPKTVRKNTHFPLLLYIATILALSFIIFGNTILNGYNLDDNLIIDRHVVKGIKGIPDIFTERYYEEEGNTYGYRPLGKATFAIEYAIWGESPGASHLVNLLLYALSAILVLLYLKKLDPGFHQWYILLVVLLFIAHPIHTEVVASLKNREGLLSFVLGMTAMLLIIEFFAKGKLLYLILSLISLSLAFLAKQDAAVFILLIPLTAFYIQKTRINLPSQPFLSALRDPLLLLSILFALIYIIASLFISNMILAIPFMITVILLLFKCIKGLRKSGRRRGIILSLSVVSIILITLAFMGGPYVFYLSYLSLLLLLIAATVSSIPVQPPHAKKQESKPASTPKLARAAFLIPLIATLLSFVVVLLVYRIPSMSQMAPEDKPLFLFENPLFISSSFAEKTALASQSLWFYTTRLIWPHPLGFYYGYNMFPDATWENPIMIFSAVLHLALLVIALWYFNKKRLLSFIILFYFFSLSIFINLLFPNTGIVAERFAFIASLAFGMALAWGIFAIAKTHIHSRKIPSKNKSTIVLLSLLILIPYSLMTISRNRDWKDKMTLFEADIDYLDQSAKAHSLYSDALMEELRSGRSTAAIQQQKVQLINKHLTRALSIDSTFGNAWHNLGILHYYYLNDAEKAIQCYRNSLKFPPVSNIARFNLATALEQTGAVDEAIETFRVVTENDSLNIGAWMGMASAFFRKNEPDSALECINKALLINPSFGTAWKNKGKIMYIKGDKTAAKEAWQRALELDPADAEVEQLLKQV